MSDGVRFIHAADLHLGAPIRGLRDVSPEWAARLQGAIAEAYSRVIDAALANDVDFVVLAGDAFDTSRASYGDYLGFFAGLERLDAAGIPAFLVAGNHDPFTTWASDVDRLPASVRLLGASGPEFALVERDGVPVCLVGGRSYYNQSWPEGDSIATGISREAALRALAAGKASVVGLHVEGGARSEGAAHAGAARTAGGLGAASAASAGSTDAEGDAHAGAAASEGGPRPTVAARSAASEGGSRSGGPRAGGARSEGAPPAAVEAPFMVGIIHTGLDIDVQKAPSDLGELLESDVDYWACGHLHKRCVFPSEADPRVVFSGCVQGRDIKETGERGCYLVELRDGGPGATRANGGPGATRASDGPDAPQPGSGPGAKRAGGGPGAEPARSSRVSLTFIPTSSVVLEQMRVDVGACQTLADVVRLVQAQLFHENGKVFSDELVVRVTLTGETALHGFLRRRDILDDLRKHINNAYPSFFCDALVDGTRPTDDEPTGGFGAIVADMAGEQRGRESVMINYVQNEFVKRGIAVPSALSRRVGVFNDAAEALVLDLLRADDEDGDNGDAGVAGGYGGVDGGRGGGGVEAARGFGGAGDVRAEAETAETDAARSPDGGGGA